MQRAYQQLCGGTQAQLEESRLKGCAVCSKRPQRRMTRGPPAAAAAALQPPLQIAPAAIDEGIEDESASVRPSFCPVTQAVMSACLQVLDGILGSDLEPSQLELANDAQVLRVAGCPSTSTMQIC